MYSWFQFHPLDSGAASLMTQCYWVKQYFAPIVYLRSGRAPGQVLLLNLF